MIALIIKGKSNVLKAEASRGPDSPAATNIILHHHESSDKLRVWTVSLGSVSVVKVKPWELMFPSILYLKISHLFLYRFF